MHYLARLRNVGAYSIVEESEHPQSMKRLKALAEEGRRPDEIARELNRTEAAIRVRARQHGIPVATDHAEAQATGSVRMPAFVRDDLAVRIEQQHHP
jgi:hypothetical protein